MLMDDNGLTHPSSLFEKARFGEDTIIGHLDTGAWPESPSFSDEGMGPIPSKWKGICQRDITGFRCNRKIIGARYFNKGYAASADPRAMRNITLNTVRDYEGHGSHTLSTLGGNFVHGANVFGLGNGTAKGGSPRARVATYKVCWPPVDENECFDSDILAAIDVAIYDGVHVLSLSLGGSDTDYSDDVLAIGAFHAVRKGITVVCAAGNSGPALGTVSNSAPWILTVAASTLDRKFEAVVELPNGQKFKGPSLSKPLPEDRLYPLISAKHAKAANASDANAELCKVGTIDPRKVKGKILVCLRGENARVEKGLVALEAGAAGMILYNDAHDVYDFDLTSDPHFLPAVELTYEDGLALVAYINSTRNPMAYLHSPETDLNTKPSPYMASFSSRGPNTITPEILKPDITAPGVNIIAAYTEGNSPTGLPFDKRRFPFITMSGTSMATPHVSGIVGLLKTHHPHWSPSAIRSAIMTTARTRDNTGKPMLDTNSKEATPYAHGSGHIRPNRAMDPGLVYDLTTNDYLNFLCACGYNQTQMRSFPDPHPYRCHNVVKILDFNYPSISIPKLYGSTTVTRKVKNVGTPGTYAARLHVPAGLNISVEPNTLKFDKIGEEKSFQLIIEVISPSLGAVFGRLSWSDGNHYVRSPIVVGAIMA
ncbi:putative tripeptidyl-peptidase II [Lupinus albus]|uniref:Putative tripeptidyl-peptidase II n=1 Tax=Lupinus albus TaxID=3870 RepID=A0A6A4NMB8_LUPAL|nr:putative tripeptidyl-peptidase II [Lupinus albus]